jgi:hypothetical protein
MGGSEATVNNIEHATSNYISINPIGNSPPNFVSGYVSPNTASAGGIISLNATWSDPEGNQIDGVEFRYKKSGGNWTVINGFSISYVLGSSPPSYNTSVIVNTPGFYQFESRAQDSYGNWSAYTSSGSFTIESPPNEPPSVASFVSIPNTISSNSTSITLQKGTDPEGDPRKIVSWSANTNYPFSSAYHSSLSTSNSPIEVTFTFPGEGYYTIYAKTVDANNNESSTISHTINYMEEDVVIPLETPVFAENYTDIEAESVISLLYGQSNLSTKCVVWATNSNYTLANPYQSSYTTGDASADVNFVFSSSGSQTIYAKTVDNLGQESNTVSINVDVNELVVVPESIVLGDFEFTANSIVVLSTDYYALSGNVKANNKLHFAQDITINTNTNMIEGEGSVYLNNIADEGTVEIYSGAFKFLADENTDKLVDQGFSIYNSAFAILDMSIYIESISLLNDGINISGELEFPEIFNSLKTTVNQIQITQSNGIQIAGSFELDDVQMNGFVLDDLIFEYNTIENSFTAIGEIETNLFEASVNLGFVDEGLNDIGMYIEVNNPKPLGTTGLALKGAGGSISNIQNPPITLAFTTTLVPAVPGPTIVEFNDITLSYTFGTSLEGSGKFSVLGQECASAGFKVEQGRFICEGNINFIDILNADISAAIIKNENDAIDIYGQFSAQATIPGIFSEEPYKWINSFLGLPHPIASTDNILFNNIITGKGTVYTDDDDDPIAMSYELKYENGEIQYDFAKNYSLFNESVFPSENNAGIALEFLSPPTVQAKSSLTHTVNRFENRSLIVKSADYLPTPSLNAFSILNNTIQQDFVLPSYTASIVVRVENSSLNPNYSLTLPNGDEINIDNVGDYDNIFKSEFENISYYTIQDADAGQYFINIENESDEYLIDIYGTKEQMGIIMNDISPTGDFINIEWLDMANETNATISLFYDTDSLGLNGSLITAGIEEDDEQNAYLWNTANLDPGTYYIYAVMHGENNEPAFAYTNNTFTKYSDVDGPENFVVQSFDEETGAVELAWDALGDAYDYLVYLSQTDDIGFSSVNYNAGSDTTYSFDNLEPSGAYQFMIVAIDSEGHISNPSAIVTVEFETEETYELQEGWNFIGLKNIPEDNSVAAVFAPIMEQLVQIKSENANYSPAVPEFLNTLTSIEVGKGYWVNVDQDITWHTIGVRIHPESNPITLNLNTGWNYISYPKTTITPIPEAIESIADKVVQVKSINSSYHPNLPDFLNTLQHFEFGQGYFINVSEDCNLIIQ